MTPAYALIQLLKLEPLNRDDIIKYTGWDFGKAEKTIKKCVASGEIKYQNGTGKYLPTVPNPQGSSTLQRIQHQLPAVWCGWISGNTPVLSAKGRGKEAFARVARRLCEMGSQRSGTQTAGEGVTA